MTEDNKEMKVVFAPGCFDSFEGSQEELDELVAEITNMVKSGELQERARAIDFDNPDEEDIEIIEHLISLTENQDKKNLQ